MLECKKKYLETLAATERLCLRENKGVVMGREEAPVRVREGGGRSPCTMATSVNINPNLGLGQI